MSAAEPLTTQRSAQPLTSLTVVVPLYDEEDGVKALGERLAAFVACERDRRPVDVVLVDDGSTDGTPERLAVVAAELPARVVRHERNRGLTEALLSGLEAGCGAYVGWLDSDLTYDPEILGELAARLDAGADVALASCYHPAGAVRGVPAWRLALSGAASRAYRLVTRAPVHTFTSMVRVQRREVIERCRPRRGGFVGVTEELLRALRAGYRVVEHPAVLQRRRVGQSKMRVLRVALAHVGLMAAFVASRLTGSGGVEPRPARS